MSYKLRNIIVLSVLCFIMAMGSGYIILYHYPKKINKVKKEITDLKRQIASLDGVQEEYENIEKIIKEKELKLANLNKKIVPAVTPATTYHYLINILKYSGVMDFDMLYQGERDAKGYKYNVYNLKGEAPFYKIYKFITYIEKGPQLYRISSLNLRMVEEKDKETGIFRVIIPFEMELWALFADVQNLPPIKRTLASVWTPRASNPFYPYVFINVQPNVDDQLEVERAELKALLPDRALIADQNKNIHELQIGDKVYLGYLKSIDTENNEVNFILNKGGIVEEFSLQMRFGEETEF